MKTRLGSLGAAVSFVSFVSFVCAATACSSTSSSPSSSPAASASTTTLSLQGAYVPADGASGPYRSIVFADDINYFLYISSCDAATDADACRRAGTYSVTVSAAATSVSLTDGTSGATTTLPFSAFTTATVSASSTLDSQIVHLDGLVTGDAGPIVTDGGTLVCANGALVHATSLSLNGTTMTRVGGASDGADATLCDPSHAVQDCADQGAATIEPSGDDDSSGSSSTCACTSRTGGATPACAGAAGATGGTGANDAGAAGRPSGGPGMQDGDGPSTGGCSGKTIMFDYQGSCDFLHRCDSYSKKLAEGQVEWGCLGHGDTCRDTDLWISVPGHSLCGHSYKFCKGTQCVTARALDVSNAGVYEASQGVLDALGIPYGGGQTSCSGTYIGSSNGKITPAATLCSN